MNKMKLSDWMAMQWLPRDMRAEKYTVGQDLTQTEAAEIVRIIARSVSFKPCKKGTRKELREIRSAYRDFIVCITMLMCVGAENEKWCDRIWFALDPDFREACTTVLPQLMRRNMDK